MNEQPATNYTITELHVDDFEPIKDYYGQLGFTVVWERQPEGFKGYLVLTMNHNTLCFWAGNSNVYDQDYFKQFSKDSKRGYGVELVIMVKDIDAYHEQVKGFANIVEPLQLRPWGLKDFRCVDPAGYYLRFTSEHNILDSKYAVE